MPRDSLRELARFVALAAPVGQVMVLVLTLIGWLDHRSALIDLVSLLIIGLGAHYTFEIAEIGHPQIQITHKH